MPSKSFVSFLLFSGGVGARSQHHEPKQFFELAGHPMIAYSLMAAAEVERIQEIIINAPPGFEERTRAIATQYCPDKAVTIIPGGKTRQDSSLQLAHAARCDTVLLHEAARPLIDAAMLEALINCTEVNAGYCHPITFSMCRVNPATGRIMEGVPREAVFNIQLPQKFDRATLISAHAAASARGIIFTEDAVMVADMTGQPVQSLPGSAKNLKVTSPEDFGLAEVTIERERI